ncbi:MAG: Asp-tRNA(Asn)/Glu-tRNA(Gln) amidotransferase subunit GatC [Planctomycetaceae bacterium]
MDAKTVNHVAELARLKMSDAEAQAMTEQLSKVLDYVEVLNEVNTDDVQPMVHAIELNNRFRTDDVRESISREEALQNAPATDGECFLVPDILKKGGS